MIAPKGSGKTHDVAEYIRQLDRVAVFDILHDHEYLGSVDDAILGNPAELYRQLQDRQTFRLAYRPVVPVDSDEEAIELDPFLRCAALAGNMTVVIDEAHHLCTARTCPEILFKAATLGRNRGLSIIYITQRFGLVARPLTANTDEFWFYRVIEPGDLKAIAERCGVEVAEQVRQLRRLELRKDGVVVPGERIVWSATEGTLAAQQFNGR